MAAKYGIEVHAWFWTMNRGDAKPEWLSYNREGQSLADRKAYVDYYRFMCPAIPEVQDFVLQKMDALAGVEGLSGIHMDYIRYVDAILPRGLWDKYGLIQDHIMPEFDYGYHLVMRSEFKAVYGYDPLEQQDVASDSLWLAFRLNALNDAVILFRDFVHRKGLQISAAVFPTPRMAKEMVRQDWSRWDLDFYFPMVYHNFYLEDTAWIRQVMEINRRVIPKETKIFCGLYLPALAEKTQLSDAMASACRGGADGIAFFDLRALQRSQLIQIKEFIRQSESNRSSLN